MAINKVEYGGNTLIDITDTTATSNSVLDGEVFYNANGTRGVGSLITPDVQINGNSIVSSGVADIETNTAYNSSTNKIATMSDVPVDTGWKNLTSTKGTWLLLRYRKFGKLVHVEGRASSFKWSGSGTDTFTTLPTGYRPTDATKQYIIALAGSRIARLYITTDGEIGIDWSLNVSNGSNYTTANWYQFQVSFFID